MEQKQQIITIMNLNITIFKLKSNKIIFARDYRNL